MLLRHTNPILATDVAAFGGVVEVPHRRLVAKGCLILALRLHFDKADTAAKDGLIVSVTVALLDDDFIFHARHFRWNISYSALVRDHDTRGGTECQRRS